MFISWLAFHLVMENNGLALCPALSWANKASYLTSNQAIIHLALNTWSPAEVQGSSCQELDKLLQAATVLPSKIAMCLSECVSQSNLCSTPLWCIICLCSALLCTIDALQLWAASELDRFRFKRTLWHFLKCFLFTFLPRLRWKDQYVLYKCALNLKE